MACRIMVDRDDDRACFICTTSDVAFGPIMKSAEWAEAFAEWLGCDPREVNVNDLIDKWCEFHQSRVECGCGEIIKGGAMCAMCKDCLELQRIEKPCESMPSST